jgi:hypothetical protein
MSCQDFDDQGMQTAWLVEDVEAFSSNPGMFSPRNRRLRYSLTHEEWLALFFDALGVDKSGFDKWATSHPGEAQFSTIGRFTEEIPTYPMLSKIQSDLDDVVFEKHEVPTLELECRRAVEETSNSLALRGLSKLLCMCEMAVESRLNIYLLGP